MDHTSTPAAAKTPVVVFHRFIPQARLPQRADRSGAGSLPVRALRYCEPITRAAAFGYYVFPPIEFSLLWDGYGVSWSYSGGDGWMPLGAAQFPGFSQYFDEHAPAAIKGFAPPFISAVQEPGLVQVWSGLVVRTQPGTSLLLRSPANLPHPGGYEVYEGIIETDRWFGPLFTALRLTRTNQPVTFNVDYPLFQVQPLPRDVYADGTLNQYELVPELDQLSEADWSGYYDAVVRPQTGNRLAGSRNTEAHIRKHSDNGPQTG